MAAPTKRLEELVLLGQLDHGSNPVLEWMARNVTVKRDPAGNMKMDKEKSGEKIDGMVALAMARAVAGTFEAKPEPKYQMLVFG